MNLLEELEKTNVNIIDDQHSEIIRVVNDYFESADNTSKTYHEFIRTLSELAKLHFQTEEKLMIDSGFENYYSHKLEHDRFLSKLKVFSIDNKSELFKFIRDWLTNHLTMKDLKLGSFLAEKQ